MDTFLIAVAAEVVGSLIVELVKFSIHLINGIRQYQQILKYFYSLYGDIVGFFVSKKSKFGETCF